MEASPAKGNKPRSLHAKEAILRQLIIGARRDAARRPGHACPGRRRRSTRKTQPARPPATGGLEMGVGYSYEADCHPDDDVAALDPLAHASRDGRHRPWDIEGRVLKHCAVR